MLSTTNSVSIVLQRPLDTSPEFLLYSSIQEIRKNGDKSYCRWPIHINLLFPFIKATSTEIQTKISTICTTIQPFTITLEKFNYLEHKNSCTVYLEIAEGKDKIINLHNLLIEEFTQCKKEDERVGGYFPHLTVAQTKSPQEAISLIEKLSLSWKCNKIKVNLDKIHWLQRDKNTAFSTKLEFFLGSNVTQTTNQLKKGDNQWLTTLVEKIYPNEWTIIPSWQWHIKEKKWKEVTNNKAVKKNSKASFSLLSYNVLYDIPDKTKGINHDTRIPALISLLKNLDVDIISLQEVTPSILKVLLEETWVRKSFYVTDCIENNASTVNPYGQIILSRFPIIDVKIYGFSIHKKIIAATISLFGVKTLVFSIHLTYGDNPEKGQRKRLEEMSVIKELSQTVDDSIITGDWNCVASNELIDMKTHYTMEQITPYNFSTNPPSDFQDILDFFENENYFDKVTFNPEENPTAKKTLLHQSSISRRIDRICIKSKNYQPRIWLRTGMYPCGCNDDIFNPSKILYPSDHYGILSIFSPTENTLKKDESWKNTHFYAFTHIKGLISCMLPWNQIYCTRVGSSFIGISQKSSDLDILVISTLSAFEFFDYLQKIISVNNIFTFNRYITEAIVPILVLSFNELQIEVQYSQVESLPDTNRPTVKSLFNLTPLNEVSKFGLYSMYDGIILQSTLKMNKNFDRFTSLYFKVVNWAKTHKITNRAIGYLSGSSMGVLCCNFLFNNTETDESNDFYNFFEFYSQFDWNYPICVSFDGKLFPSEPFEVLDKTSNVIDARTPYGNQNIHRHMTRSTYRRITSEIKYANKNFDKIDALIESFDKHITTVLDGELEMTLSIVIGYFDSMSSSDVSSWNGFCISRIAIVINRLEEYCGPGFLCVPHLKDDNCIQLFIVKQGNFTLPSGNTHITEIVRNVFFKTSKNSTTILGKLSVTSPNK